MTQTDPLTALVEAAMSAVAFLDTVEWTDHTSETEAANVQAVLEAAVIAAQERNNAEASYILGAIEAALNGESPSDFAESFPIVRQVQDLVMENYLSGPYKRKVEGATRAGEGVEGLEAQEKPLRYRLCAKCGRETGEWNTGHTTECPDRNRVVSQQSICSRCGATRPVPMEEK